MADPTDDHSFPKQEEEFENDDRISFDKVSQTYKLEDAQDQEWEWLAVPKKWIQVVRTLRLLSLRMTGSLACVHIL